MTHFRGRLNGDTCETLEQAKGAFCPSSNYHYVEMNVKKYMKSREFIKYMNKLTSVTVQLSNLRKSANKPTIERENTKQTLKMLTYDCTEWRTFWIHIYYANWNIQRDRFVLLFQITIFISKYNFPLSLNWSCANYSLVCTANSMFCMNNTFILNIKNSSVFIFRCCDLQTVFSLGFIQMFFCFFSVVQMH